MLWSSDFSPGTVHDLRSIVGRRSGFCNGQLEWILDTEHLRGNCVYLDHGVMNVDTSAQRCS